ncbi:MAG: VOC family protein [Candidatus Omnitrophica bacterium]|nr:VOC family protein [Candidatus Omnitrophota bacterium]
MKIPLAAFALTALLAMTGWAEEEDFALKTIHIGMIVKDLEQSMKFYKDVVGMVQVDTTEFSVDADFGKKSGLTDSLPIHVQVLKLGKGENATQLKLMTFGDKAQPQENEYIHSHTGIQYITIMVNDLTPILERIKKHKVKRLGDTPIAMGDNYFVLIQDPDGTFVELIGPIKEAKK